MTTPSVADMLRAIITLKVDRIRPMRGQPRKYFNKHKLKKLMVSLKKAGQKLPILVHPIEGDPQHDYEIVDGERRWRSKKLAGERSIPAIVINAENLEEFFEISAIANFGRENHTPLEIANALQRVRAYRIKKDGRCTEADLAEMFAQTITWVSHHLLLLKLAKEVQDLMDPDRPSRERLNRTAAVQISRLPMRMQLPLANKVLREKMSLNQVRLEARTLLQGKASEDAPFVFRGRPVNRYRSLHSLLSNFEKNAGVLLNIPRGELQEAINGRTKAERDQLLQLLRECESKRRSLQEVVEHSLVTRLALASR